jgi:maltose O-acetyltransferase
MGAVVIPGIQIGNGAVVGAGAVVIRNVGEGETVAGNPARPLAARARTSELQ